MANLYKRTTNLKCSKVREINVREIHPARAGIIPYYYSEEETYFMLGIDTKFHELTDLSGSVKYKKESCIDCAIREFNEESLNVFSIDKNQILENYAFYDEENMVIFARLELNNFEEIQKTFKKRLERNNHPEICGLVFLTSSQFTDLILKETGIINGFESVRMYERIRNFLWNNDLHQLEILNRIL